MTSSEFKVVAHETEVSKSPDSVRAKMKAVGLVDSDYFVSFSTDP